MAKDPAFLFYPGDYLRDTQCLSEKAQVAYDRIMCEHMRNICDDMNKIAITKDRIDFFSKKLSPDEKSELYHVLKKVDGGFHIEWVAESVSKRKSYSISRADNRRKKDMNNISEHMENEIENEIENINASESGAGDYNLVLPFTDEKFLLKWGLWKKYKKEQHRFTYKSQISEQAALKKIGELSHGDLETALLIIQESIDNSWKGFFELKNRKNGHSKTTDISHQNADKLRRIMEGNL